MQAHTHTQNPCLASWVFHGRPEDSGADPISCLGGIGFGSAEEHKGRWATVRLLSWRGGIAFEWRGTRTCYWGRERQRSNVTDCGTVLMRWESLLAHRKQWRKAICLLHYFKWILRKETQGLGAEQFASTWSKMACAVCRENVTLCIRMK